VRVHSNLPRINDVRMSNNSDQRMLHELVNLCGPVPLDVRIAKVSPSSVAALMSTSGTTGGAKTAEKAHRSLAEEFPKLVSCMTKISHRISDSCSVCQSSYTIVSTNGNRASAPAAHDLFDAMVRRHLCSSCLVPAVGDCAVSKGSRSIEEHARVLVV
jgi:acyl-coenzyme A synthetase/AMP-(fatty) acid ligase